MIRQRDFRAPAHREQIMSQDYFFFSGHSDLIRHRSDLPEMAHFRICQLKPARVKSLLQMAFSERS
jgi:hypothetical protein